MSPFSVRLIQNHIDMSAQVVTALSDHLTSYSLSIVTDIYEATSEPEPAQVILLNSSQLSNPPDAELACLAAAYDFVPIFLLVPEIGQDLENYHILSEALKHGASDYVTLSETGLMLLGRRLRVLQREWLNRQRQETTSLGELLAQAISNDKSELPIQLFGSGHRVKAWNSASETFFQIDRADAEGHPIDQLPLSAGDLSRIKDVIDQARSTRQPFFIPFLALKGQKSSAPWVNIHAYPIPQSMADNAETAPVDVCTVIAELPSLDEMEQFALHRNQDLQILLEANRQISEKLELRPILDTIAEQIKLLLFGDNCQIYLLEKDNKTLRPVHEIGPLASRIGETPLVIGQDQLADLATAGKATAVRASHLQSPIPYAGDDFLLGVPLTALNGIIGLIVVSRRSPPFSDHEVYFSESLAQQASLAINNARLFEGTQRNLREIATLYEASTAISIGWDDQDVLNTLIRQMVQAINVSRGFIARWDRNKNKSLVQADFINYLKSSFYVTKLDRTIELSQRATLVTLIDQQRPVFLSVSNPSLDEIERKEMLKCGCLSRLVLPLIAKGETIGWAELWETEEERHFSADEVRLARALSSQIAVALQNIRYLKQTQRTLEETTALYRVASALTSLQDPQAIIGTVLQEFLKALDLKQGSVIIFDFATKNGIIRAHLHDDDPVRPPRTAFAKQDSADSGEDFIPMEGQQIPLRNNPVYEKLMRTTLPVVIDEPGAQWLTKPPSFRREVDLPPVGGWGDEQAFSILVIPVRIRDMIVGTLVAENTHHNRPFDHKEISIGQAMADQLGVGLQNVQLYEAEYRRREQAETLREVAAVVNSSLKLNEVLERVLDQLGRVVRYDSAAIHLIEGRRRRVIAGRGFRNIKEHIGLTFPIEVDNENEPGSIAIQKRRPLVFGDVSGTSDSFREERHSHIRSWMGIPLIARDKVIGLISIDNSEANVYHEEELELAQAFANQVAITLENARLYEIEVRELERELTIAQEIQETLLPQLVPQIPGLEIAGRIIPARQVGGDFFHFFTLNEDELCIAIGDVSGKGMPAALYMAAGITAIETQIGPNVTPAALLNKLSAKLYNRLRENKMNIALQIARFGPISINSRPVDRTKDGKETTLTVANAGMIAPIGALEGACRYLPVGGLPVGALPASQYDYHDEEFLLDDFTTIIFTSDGIVEAQNKAGEMFGFERLEETILEIVHTHDAQAITDHIIDAAQAFTGEAEQHDDMMVVVVVVTDPQRKD